MSMYIRVRTLFTLAAPVRRQQASASLLHHKWENAFTIDSTTWGYKRNSDLGDCKLSSSLSDENALRLFCKSHPLCAQT